MSTPNELTPQVPSSTDTASNLRRLPTYLGIGLLLASVILLVCLWGLAWHDGKVKYVQRFYGVTEEFRGNHGPWRHDVELGLLLLYSSLCALVSFFISIIAVFTDRQKLIPFLCFLFSLGMLVANLMHLDLFD